MQFEGRENLIKQVQEILNLKDDGIDGLKTWNAILDFCKAHSKVTPVQNNTPQQLSPAAFKLIMDHEVGGGEAYYNRALRSPTYPGGASGVTIGIGYDLGYNTKEQFEKDWAGVLPSDVYNRLSSHIGKKSETARAAISSIRDIKIPWAAALEVFVKSTLPRFIAETNRAFPGASKLKGDAFGALVSLVFNRGSSLSGPSRVEMLNIKKALDGDVNGNTYDYIANQIIQMKRLWVGKGLDGLLRRRDEEAQLVKQSK